MAGLTRPTHYGLLSTPVEGHGGQSSPRSDWRQLSSGVGVPPGPGSTLPFPRPNVRSTVPESLPPATEPDSRIPDFDEVFNHWETTSRAAHGPKTQKGIYAQPAYPLISRVKRTLGIKNLAEKLQHHNYQQPLIMSNPKSEMRDKYQGWPNLGSETIIRLGPQPWDLADHHTQGPSQTLIPSSRNPALSGKSFSVPDQGVLDCHQPYLTTTARDFRYYTKKDLAGYSRKNCLTYQNFSTQPQLLQLKPLQPLPQVPSLGQSHQCIPHRGALSETRESYNILEHSLRLADHFCPLEAPWVGPQVKSMPRLQTVPHAYRTENSSYGSLKPDFV